MNNWNTTTVPVAVEEQHELSLLIGKAFAMSYYIHTHCEQTAKLLDMYREARRMVDRPNAGDKRYGSLDAWYSTQ